MTIRRHLWYWYHITLSAATSFVELWVSWELSHVGRVVLLTLAVASVSLGICLAATYINEKSKST